MENTGQMDIPKDNSFLKMEYADRILFIKDKLDIPLKRLAEKIYSSLRKNNPNDDEEAEAEKKYVESFLKAMQRSKENKGVTRKKTVLRLKEAFTVLVCLPEVKKLNLPPDFEDWENRDNEEYIRDLCEEYFQLLDKHIVVQPNERFLNNLNNIIQAANNGHIQAQTAVGEFYFNGGTLNIPNFSLAFDYFVRAANQHCPRALWKLGLMQEDKDFGLSPNIQLAFRYFKLSADQDFPMALNRIACCYGNGDGTERDDKLFFEYAKKSADLGNEIGQLSVAYAYCMGKGVEQNWEKAAKIYEEVSLKKSYMFHCFARLAYMYSKGLGVGKNADLASIYYGMVKKLFDKQYPYHKDESEMFEYFLNLDLDSRPYALLSGFKKGLKAKLLGTNPMIYDERMLPRYLVPEDEKNIFYDDFRQPEN